MKHTLGEAGVQPATSSLRVPHPTLAHELSLTRMSSPWRGLQVEPEVSDTLFAAELAVIDPSPLSMRFLHRRPQPALSRGFCRPTSLLALKSLLLLDASFAAVLTVHSIS